MKINKEEFMQKHTAFIIGALFAYHLLDTE